MSKSYIVRENPDGTRYFDENTPTGQISPDTIGAGLRIDSDGKVEVDDTAVVKIADAQTITGTKTFLASPLVPTPTLGDSSDKTANTAFIRQSMGAGLEYNSTTKQIETTLKYAGRDLVFYVRTNGDDSNDGLTEGTAVATISKAFELSKEYYYGQYECTIDIGAGTFNIADTLYIYKHPASVVIIRGAGSSSTTIKSSYSGPYAIYTTNSSTFTVLQGFTLEAMGATQYVIGMDSLSMLNVANVVTRASSAGLCYVSSGSRLGFTGPVSHTTSSCVNMIVVNVNSVILLNNSVTLNGTVSTACVSAVNSGVVVVAAGSAPSMSGSVTGRRYNCSINGVINASGRGATFIPGTAAGTTATGGQYYG